MAVESCVMMAATVPDFEDVYREFARSVHAVLLSRLPPEDAEEATQDVFVIARGRLGEASELGPWLHTIARNLAIDRLRARKRLREVPLPDLARPSATDEELRSRILHHLQELPEAYRETLTMRLVEGMTGPEIAAVTGMTPESVRVNLCRGMELLRTPLRKDGWP